MRLTRAPADLQARLSSPPHLILHVVAGQDDPPVFPLAALVLADDPEDLALLAGFAHHLQRHPAAAGGLVLELHAHRASRQVHRRADEPRVLAVSPAVTLQPQEIPVIWGKQARTQVPGKRLGKTPVCSCCPSRGKVGPEFSSSRSPLPISLHHFL